MSLSIGIVGLPNVGKSTLFNALTEKSVPAENYPFCTIDPSVGIVEVPDERVEKLNEFSHSAKKIPAAIEFVDIAGLVKGASEGEGLGNTFLSHIREVDAIAHVVRVFDDGNVTHVSGSVDPVSDIGVINLELILADLQTVTKRIGNLDKLVKRNDKDAVFEMQIAKKLEAVLIAGQLASTVSLDEKEQLVARGLHLLSMKPMLYVLNRKAGSFNIDEHPEDPRHKALFDYFATNNLIYTTVDAAIEGELKQLEVGERAVYKEELGVKNDGINDLIVAGYKLLDLISFFTTGEDETRAWTIKRDSTAPQAGAAIHTDFQEKFIRAEVIHWDQLLDSGSYGKAREKGLLRTEGKEYVVQDGDVIEFKV